jgi:CDP-paratose 2-epimerase
VFEFVKGDIRDFGTLCSAVNTAQPDLILHLASQVAVTTSIANPRHDFEVNALGTFNVLEAARLAEMRHGRPHPAVFYASTNKVYGGLDHEAVVEEKTRYAFKSLPDGVNEDAPLDFHSPYGCSKGTGDQYVRDYARIFGLRTVVFRQSCIYGLRQFGVEDQGWVAHFIIAAAMGRPITIYGDGRQVRDLLNVRDLIAAYDAAWQRLDAVSGQVFNVGGGTANALSIWAEFGPMLEQLAGRNIDVTRKEIRPGDQPVFISDNARAEEMLGWSPKVGVAQGIRELWHWVNANKALFD